MSKMMPSIILDQDSINKEAGEQNSPDPVWFDEFQKNLKMTQANPYDSIHDQIYSIMNNAKPKFSSVQEMVDDLQERTGLKKFLDAKRADDFTSLMRRSASIQEFNNSPELKEFIDTYVKDRPGTNTPEAVVSAIMKDRDIADKLDEPNEVSEDVYKYIFDLISETQKSNSAESSIAKSQLGKVDISDSNDIDDNNNPLAFCEPAKLSSMKLRFVK